MNAPTVGGMEWTEHEQGVWRARHLQLNFEGCVGEDSAAYIVMMDAYNNTIAESCYHGTWEDAWAEVLGDVRAKASFLSDWVDEQEDG